MRLQGYCRPRRGFSNGIGNPAGTIESVRRERREEALLFGELLAGELVVVDMVTTAPSWSSAMRVRKTWLFSLSAAAAVTAGSNASDFLGFFTASPIPSGGDNHTIEAADLNGDGLVDLVLPNFEVDFDSVSVVLNTRGGTFAAPILVDLGARPWAARSADLDLDGDLDICVNATDGMLVTRVHVLLNDGDANFTPGGAFLIAGQARQLRLADLNGDGVIDAVTVNHGSNNISVLMGDGAGGFSPQSVYLAGHVPADATIGDINMDGAPDLVVANAFSKDVSIFLNDGSGEFPVEQITTFQLPPPPGSTFVHSPNSVVIQDFNNDGVNDLIIAHGGPWWAILFGVKDGGLGEPILIAAPAGMVDVIAPDLDEDGDLDLMFTQPLDRSLAVWLNDGDGNFELVQEMPTLIEPLDIAIADFDHDGDLDAAVAHALAEELGLHFQASGPFAPDFNGDGVVNGIDLAHLLAQWGGPGDADVNRSGIVDGVDLTAVLFEWGPIGDKRFTTR